MTYADKNKILFNLKNFPFEYYFLVHNIVEIHKDHFNHNDFEHASKFKF